jgi:hypothetical protein
MSKIKHKNFMRWCSSSVFLYDMHIFPRQVLFFSAVVSIASIFVCSLTVVKYWKLKRSLHAYPSQLPMNPGHIHLKMVDTNRFQILGDNDEEDWNRLYPQGYGFAYLGESHEMFGVSMFHQFHCLQTIRQAIIDRDIYGHAQHCLTYLRNAILCSSDLTLEPQFEPGKVDGLGVTHQCRNWTAVYEWLDNNYAEHLAWNSTYATNSTNSQGGYWILRQVFSTYSHQAQVKALCFREMAFIFAGYIDLVNKGAITVYRYRHFRGSCYFVLVHRLTVIELTLAFMMLEVYF